MPKEVSFMFIQYQIINLVIMTLASVHRWICFLECQTIQRLNTSP